uniref:Uncharacterized protein n=1 Tax=Meloidogyne hapla TaxID=6305 RepID=A0A1I8B4X7_MELHA
MVTVYFPVAIYSPVAISVIKRYETLRKYYLLNNAAKEIYSLLYKEILQPKYINFGQLNRATFYTPKRTFCESLCGIKSEIPFDEDVNSVTYEAKYPSYKVKKFDQWTRNFNLTIAKLLVVYTRFARFYKLKTIYDEFVEKVNFNVGGKIFDEVNKWKLPEDFEELVNRRLNKILEKNKEEDEEEDEEE